MMRSPSRILTVFTASLVVLLAGCRHNAPTDGSEPRKFKLPKFSWKNGKKKDTPEAAAAPVVAAAVERTPEEAAFLEKCAALGAAGGVITGRDDFYFPAVELQRVGRLTDANAPSVRSALAAISDYQDQLKRKGIDLVFVPVPPKAVIYPDKLAKDLKVKVKRKKPARLDSTLQTAWETLRKRGVRVVDVTPALLGSRSDKKAGEIFPKSGAAWSPRAARIAAEEIAREVRSGSWSSKSGPAMTTEDTLLAYTGPLPSTAGGKSLTENLSVRNIGIAEDGKMRSVTFSRSGHPLTILGDANVLAWREANNPANASGAFSSLADQLAYELQTTPDVLADRGDGRNEPRVRILREGTSGRNLLSGTKTVVWVVNATDLATGDWRKVPLRLEFNFVEPDLQLDSSSPKPAPSAAPAMDAPAPGVGPDEVNDPNLVPLPE